VLSTLPRAATGAAAVLLGTSEILVATPEDMSDRSIELVATSGVSRVCD
jgi:hypothetical protein